MPGTPLKRALAHQALFARIQLEVLATRTNVSAGDCGMSNGKQPESGSSARELPNTQRGGGEYQSPEPLDPIHESATIHPPIHDDAAIFGAPGTLSDAADQPASLPVSGPITDRDEFRQVLVGISLINEDEFDSLTVDVPPSDGVLGLARALQRAGKLTAYQAAAVYQRKSRGLLIGNYLILDKLGAGGMG
jgi:hypothetical protein